MMSFPISAIIKRLFRPELFARECTIFIKIKRISSGLNYNFTQKLMLMSKKTISVIKAIALILAGLAVLMHLQIIIIPAIVSYNFWMVVVAFGLVLLTSKYSISLIDLNFVRRN